MAIVREHHAQARENDLKGARIGRQKWDNIKGRYVKVNTLPVTYLFVRENENEQEKINSYLNKRRISSWKI